MRNGAKQGEKDCGAALRAAGAEPIQAYAVAFLGKEVRVASLPSQARGPLRS